MGHRCRLLGRSQQDQLRPGPPVPAVGLGGQHAVRVQVC